MATGSQEHVVDEVLSSFVGSCEQESESFETLLDTLEAKTRRDIDALVAVHDGLDSRRFRFERLTARHGILIKQARLAWIAEARGTFELVGGDVS